MGTINTAIQLANIRSKIDAQQQVVSLLEAELQKAILGDDQQTIGGVFGQVGVPGGTQPTIGEIYGNLVSPQDSDGEFYGDGEDLYNAMLNPFIIHFDGDGSGVANDQLDQTAIRQILYQARALLGELRVEEQHWNQEVTQEKERRKELGEFAKG
jgi:hypothetical protein